MTSLIAAHICPLKPSIFDDMKELNIYLNKNDYPMNGDYLILNMDISEMNY